jgi:hypothetical protein
MSGNDVWARCIDCGTELKQSDNRCPKCGSIKKSFVRMASESIGIRDGIILKQRRIGVKKFLLEIIDRWKSSGDPKLKQEVHEFRVIDKGKNEYHHIVKDAKTGEVIHEEHEPLSQHKQHSQDTT